MSISEKCAYIKGLMDGMELDVTTKEGKVLSAIVDLLGDVCKEVENLDQDMDQVFDELDAIDEDMDDLTEAFYEALEEVDEDEEDEEDEDEDDEEYGVPEYELTCPKCGGTIIVDEETLMDEDSEIICQGCGASIEIEFGSGEGECDCEECAEE